MPTSYRRLLKHNNLPNSYKTKILITLVYKRKGFALFLFDSFTSREARLVTIT